MYATFAGPDRFRFGLLSAVLGVIALVTLPLQNRALRFNAALLVLGWLVILFVQLEPARVLWDHTPLVRFIQFPWRLYGPGSLAVALSIGMLLNSDRFGRWHAWARWLINGLIVVAAILAGTNGLNIEHLPLWVSIPEEQINAADLQRRGANNFPLFIDYTPASMSVYANVVTLPPEDPPAVTAGAASAPRIDQMSLVRNGVNVQTTADAPFTLRLHRVYFPGWRATVDDQPVPVSASEQLGLVSIEVPAGVHQISAQFEQTPLRQAADVVSFLALLGMCVALVWFSPTRRKVLWTSVVLVLFAGAVLGISRIPAIERQPASYQAVLGDGVQLLAYDLNQQTLQPGDVLELRLYWYTDRIPTDDRQIFIHLVTPDDSARVAQVDQISTFGHIPITRWEDGPDLH
ncbi:MAG: hypothetical protein IPK16_15105 [Anaerolineales bacterium]|nr:hypothetical protein [Anaerolineales bacterium]